MTHMTRALRAQSANCETANKDFFERVDFFNPEPVVLRFWEKNFPSLRLYRRICWYSLDKNGISNPHNTYQDAPFKQSLELISSAVLPTNTSFYLPLIKDGDKYDHDGLNFEIKIIEWTIQISSKRPLYAPPMAGRLEAGFKVAMSNAGITARYQHTDELHESTYNETRVVPVTAENLMSVLQFLKETHEKA